MLESTHESTLCEWLARQRPMRTLLVRSGPLASPAEARLSTQAEQLIATTEDWRKTLPDSFRPVAQNVSVDGLDQLPEDQTFDLALCPEAIDELPAGVGATILDQLCRIARFVAVVIRTTGFDASRWPAHRWKQIEPLSLHLHQGSLAMLVRGGVREYELPDGPKIYYLAPNRQIFGGVKILYNHVDILNSLGIPAALAVEESENWPADWFAWNPRNLAFASALADIVTAEDTVVIPEIFYLRARRYCRAGRRLLFAQGPGLTRGFSRWSSLGFDGVLTLNCPDGRVSNLSRFLETRTKLPVCAISNHYSDDAWGKATAPRVPGRILCMPRKGKSQIDRLETIVGQLHRVENKRQSEMAVEYAQADIVLMTGYPEGQPMPAIEGMLSGCIVCGYTGGGGRDVMAEGQTAYVAEDGDFDGLVASVRRAISDPRREQVRAAGAELARAFTRDVTSAELLQCYRAWLPDLPQAKTSKWNLLAEQMQWGKLVG